MQTGNIRDLIAEGEIKEAIAELLPLLPPSYLDNVRLLQSQLANWERDFRLGMGAKEEERNRITYATLYYISKLEAETHKGPKALKAKRLAKIEKEIAFGHMHLGYLSHKSDLDLLLEWVEIKYPQVLEQLIIAERASPFPAEFDEYIVGIDWDPYIELYQIEATGDQITFFLQQRQRQTAYLISSWLEGQNNKKRYAHLLTQEVEKAQSQYSKLLKAGVIGGIFGAIGSQFISGSIMQLVESLSGEMTGSSNGDEPEPIYVDDDD